MLQIRERRGEVYGILVNLTAKFLIGDSAILPLSCVRKVIVIPAGKLEVEVLKTWQILQRARQPGL